MASPVQPSHPQLAVSAAIFRDDKILLVRRARFPARGLYSLPGGRVEFGETLQAALHREVDEETSLRIEIIGLAGWREVVLNDELDDFRWLSPGSLGDLQLTAGLQEMIQRAQDLLRT